METPITYFYHPYKYVRMRKLTIQRICGNCAHAVTNRAHGAMLKSFKCDIDMSWVSFDERCEKDHRFDNEEPVKKAESKQKEPEAIDLGGIPASIRPETSA